MSFHIQFHNVSAYNVTSALIKKPEKDLHFKDVWRGVWKIVHTVSTTILAMSLCFIAEGYFKIECLLSYLRRELILYHRINCVRMNE